MMLWGSVFVFENGVAILVVPAFFDADRLITLLTLSVSCVGQAAPDPCLATVHYTSTKKQWGSR